MSDRHYDYGAFLTQRGTKGAAIAVHSPGLYSGFVPTILGPNQLSLSPGSLLSPAGVIWRPTADITVPNFPVVALPNEYTLVAYHEDIQATGGSSFLLRWEVGILAPVDTAENAVAVLYVRQDVAGPLEDKHLSQPSRLTSGVLTEVLRRRLDIRAPFAAFNLNTASGPNIQILNESAVSGAQYLSQRFKNTASVGLQQITFDLPVPVEDRTTAVDVFCEIPALGSIAISALGDDGTAIAGDTIATTITDVTNGHRITFAQETPLISVLRLVVVVPAGTSAYIHRMALVVD